MPTEAELRRAILEKLRAQSRQQDRTSAILTFDVSAAAQTHGVEPEEIENILSDLRVEGLIEEYAAGLSESVITGHCRITGAGIAYLRGL